MKVLSSGSLTKIVSDTDGVKQVNGDAMAEEVPPMVSEQPTTLSKKDKKKNKKKSSTEADNGNLADGNYVTSG